MLAGGDARRFGADKRYAEVAGVSMLTRVATCIAAACDELVIVARGDRPPPIPGVPHRFVADDAPGEGPLAAIVTGLRAATSEWSVVASCDLPLIHPAVVEHVISLASDDADAVVPLVGGSPQVLLAAYRRTCIEPFRERLDASERRVAAALEGLRVRYVDERVFRSIEPGLGSFHNVNTPDDLGRAESLAASGEPQ